MSNSCTLAAYYFGNYHPGDTRNTRLKGASWSEWQLVREAWPRFPGHVQPRTPLWGYGDESDPAVMARKIDAAADHGVDAFIFDWYPYNWVRDRYLDYFADMERRFPVPCYPVERVDRGQPPRTRRRQRHGLPRGHRAGQGWLMVDGEWGVVVEGID